MRRAVSEFPNDNAELHDGLVWSVPSPCGRALPTLRLRPPSGPAPRVLGPAWLEVPEQVVPEPNLTALPQEQQLAEEALVVEEAPVLVVEVNEPALVAEAEAELVAEVEEPELVAEAEASLIAEAEEPELVAEGVPQGPFGQFVAALVRVLLERGATRAAAVVKGLLCEERVAADGLDRGVLEALHARGIIERGSSRPTEHFAAVARAWRGVLDGTVTDLSACGATTLDAWAAQTLGALLNTPRDRTDDLRRELRKRGVAAFGLLAA